jgi:DNA-directed RNA polymerase subunit RPC12/RpoP
MIARVIIERTTEAGRRYFRCGRCGSRWIDCGVFSDRCPDCSMRRISPRDNTNPRASRGQ